MLKIRLSRAAGHGALFIARLSVLPLLLHGDENCFEKTKKKSKKDAFSDTKPAGWGIIALWT